MSFIARQDFPGREEAFPAVVDFVGRVCAGAGLEHPVCLRLILVVEELFTNTVKYAFAPEGGGTVSIAFSLQADALRLSYEDDGMPFDPLGAVGASTSGAVESRPIGGLGLALVRALTRSASYERSGGRNRLALEIPLS